MTLKVRDISVTPAGKIRSKGGWSNVIVEFADAKYDVTPRVTVEVFVPCKLTDTYETTRAEGLERSKQILKAALKALDETEVAATGLQPR